MTAEGEARVRAAFAEQAVWCERLGSTLTARLCSMLGARLERGTSLGDRVLGWAGDPAPMADGLPLRLCGGLHNLFRRGEAASLARVYPPSPLPTEEALWTALGPVLEEKADYLAGWIEIAPQTNEVGRSALLMSGLMVAAARFPMPIRLFELGASAGLNLVLDRYLYRLGGREAGDPQSPLCLAPEWEGAPPPAARVEIVGRAGVDLAPMDVRTEHDRLLAYVWPDQEARLRQIETAIAIAALDPPPIEQGDAADWLERRLATVPEPGVLRVVMHSVAFQYFPSEAQRRIASHLAKAGAKASEEAPLGWLRFEKVLEDKRFSLRLRLWPGEDARLAWADPHGKQVEWFR